VSVCPALSLLSPLPRPCFSHAMIFSDWLLVPRAAKRTFTVGPLLRPSAGDLSQPTDVPSFALHSGKKLPFFQSAHHVSFPRSPSRRTVFLNFIFQPALRGGRSRNPQQEALVTPPSFASKLKLCFFFRALQCLEALSCSMFFFLFFFFSHSSQRDCSF